MTKELVYIQHRSPLRFVNILGFFLQAMEIYKQRRALETLDNAALRDIGINAAQRDTECARKFWDF